METMAPPNARNQIAVLRDEKPLSLEKTLEETMTVDTLPTVGVVKGGTA